MLSDLFDPRELDECGNCNGSGQVCAKCTESVDNCECTDDGSTWVDCPECDGEGKVENGLSVCSECDETDCVCGGTQ